MTETFDRACHQRKYTRNHQMAADAQADHIRDLHLKMADFYTAVLAAYCEVDEPPALMVRTS
jgi:hypothetical protein